MFDNPATATNTVSALFDTMNGKESNFTNMCSHHRETGDLDEEARAVSITWGLL